MTEAASWGSASSSSSGPSAAAAGSGGGGREPTATFRSLVKTLQTLNNVLQPILTQDELQVRWSAGWVGRRPSGTSATDGPTDPSHRRTTPTTTTTPCNQALHIVAAINILNNNNNTDTH